MKKGAVKKYMEKTEIDICNINTVENKARQNDIKSEFRQRTDIEMIFLIHQVADGDKNEKRKNIICDNL